MPDLKHQLAENFDLSVFLSSLPLFANVREFVRMRLAEKCQLQQFQRGTLMFQKGSPCHAFHVVVSGQVKLFALSPQGNEKVVSLMGPGQSFAEAAMFMHGSYPVSIEAVEDTLLLSMNRQAVMQEISKNPQFATRMLAGLSQRLHVLMRDIQTYALENGPQRVINYLLNELPANQGQTQGDSLNLTLPASKYLIASRLSITPEYFSRILARLSNDELIVVDKRQIHIPSVSKLRTYAQDS